MELPKLPWPWIRVGGGLAAIAMAAMSYAFWWPPLSQWIDSIVTSRRAAQVDHGGHNHAEPPGVNAVSLTLTPQARMNLGLTADYLQPIELSTYRRSLTVPAVVVPRPGRTQIVVASPLNGVITHVHAVTGEAVKPGELLFEIRLTYEDLVETQTQYLKSISEIEVEDREIARLERATQSGAVSGKSLLDRRYAKEKLEALLRSQREALRLHGLSDRQVDAIGTEGKLLRDLQVVAPDVDRHDENEELRLSHNSYHPVSFHPDGQFASGETPLVIEDLQIHKGQAVVAGERLCSLSDYSQLYIEGKAFEQDVDAISRSVERGWAVDAAFPCPEGQKMCERLKLAYVGNSIDPDSRTLSLFVELPNEVVRDERNAEGQRFISWKYRLGQRLEVQVTTEQWEDQIVLPIDALANEGANWYVFQQNGANFERKPVHVQYRDQTSAVIAHDGSIFPGDIIARRSAHQMLIALKNKSGAAADPHAGHTH